MLCDAVPCRALPRPSPCSTQVNSKYNMPLQCIASDVNRPDPDPTLQEVNQDLIHLHPRWKIDSSGCCSGGGVLSGVLLGGGGEHGNGTMREVVSSSARNASSKEEEEEVVSWESG